MTEHAKFDESTFNAILASSVHDMKNSLGMLMNTLEELAVDISEDDKEKFEKFSYLQYQASRVNNDLMTLLSLYKIDHDQYPFSVEEVLVEDFLDEQMLRYMMICERGGVEISVDCDDELWWYFDANLVSGAINDTLGNAIRYTNSKIVLRASEENGMLRITVEDDGNGYPEHILKSSVEQAKKTSFESGSTGLGLYFAFLVADMHTNKDKKGTITLDNDSPLGGGRFSILLP